MSDDQGWNTVKKKADRPKATASFVSSYPRDEPTAGAMLRGGGGGGLRRSDSDYKPGNRVARPGPDPAMNQQAMPRRANLLRVDSTNTTPTVTPVSRTEDYFSSVNESVKLPTGEVSTDELTIDTMKSIAKMIYKYRSKFNIPSELDRLNTDPGTTRAKSSGRGGGDSSRNEFQRGQKAFEDHASFETGGGGKSFDAFARGQKAYSASQVSKSSRGGSKRYQEDYCDPNLVIQRINVDEFLAEETKQVDAEETKKVDAEETVATETPPDEEGGEMNFVRRQARRKADEDEDARVERNLRGLLNKLSEINYNSILEKTVGTNGISTEKHLRSFVNFVFEKAAQMEKFISIYARLLLEIRPLLMDKVIPADDGGRKRFKRIVLDCFENAYEKWIKEDWEPPADYDEEDKFNAYVLRKNQRRGVVSFIAKLAQNGLLARKIMELLCVEMVTFGCGTPENPIPVVEKFMETMIHLFQCFFYEPEDYDKLPASWKKSLVLLNRNVPAIRALIERDVHPAPTRINFLLKDLLETWDIIYVHEVDKAAASDD